ncbi:hypothetical protein TL16_g12106 [Triparma laevis f. inornata]|uniref:PepSY domain-containing protein n=1 Tax=Triparma laevis f. inornata TaxID=1714386 RepID=A0A9W7BJM7_9STRA|nr:hypothetical protein TL16_g12106 [Triparma laevis f. inornata]
MCYGIICLILLIIMMIGSAIVNRLTADEGSIDLSSVPQIVLDAVYKATNGTITAAEFEIEAGIEIYEVTVTDGDVEYEVDVSPEGEVLDLIIDDDSDDDRLLIYGYVMAYGGAFVLVCYGVCMYKKYVGDMFWEKKKERGEGNLVKKEGNDTL